MIALGFGRETGFAPLRQNRVFGHRDGDAIIGLGHMPNSDYPGFPGAVEGPKVALVDVLGTEVAAAFAS